jgi:hypothetical protein
MSLIAADMDNDGDQDILLSDRKEDRDSRGVRWLENPGAEVSATGVAWQSHLIGGADREVMFIDRGDLDGDGDQDVAAVFEPRWKGDPSGILWFASPGNLDTGSWTRHSILWPTGVGSGKAVAIVDTDKDGRSDLLVSCEHAQDSFGVFRLSAHGAVESDTWKFSPVSDHQGIKYDLCLVLDVDQDGWEDVLTTEERAPQENGDGGLGLVWYRNPGSDVDASTQDK